MASSSALHAGLFDNLLGANGVLTGDLNGNGFVGIADLNPVLDNWHAGTPPDADAVATEPVSLVIV